jgi:hypothetical protein
MIVGQKRYYSSDYGWRQLEHGHVIQLRHLKDDVSMFICACGENYVGPERILGARIMAHRMENFPKVRRTLND